MVGVEGDLHGSYYGSISAKHESIVPVAVTRIGTLIYDYNRTWMLRTALPVTGDVVPSSLVFWVFWNLDQDEAEKSGVHDVHQLDVPLQCMRSTYRRTVPSAHANVS